MLFAKRFDCPGHFTLILPINVFSDVGFVETYRGYEIPDAPYSFFLKIGFTDELKLSSKVEA